MFFGMLAIAGGIGGFVFWLVRRPDKDARRTSTPQESPPEH